MAEVSLRLKNKFRSNNIFFKENNREAFKQKRINGTHRWTDAETLHLVQEVAEEVKDKIESYEKPTAQYFYKKIAAKSTIPKSIEWVPMKNKMRHLKSSYMSALNWRNQTGAGLLATGNEKTVEEYIDKICPMFKYLEQIFGQRRGVNPLIIIETSMEDQDIDCVVGEVEIFQVLLIKKNSLKLPKTIQVVLQKLHLAHRHQLILYH
ncbi:uncharacterized protein LOC124421452 [Lucilia cuprina]|uniref:uncharacterized protein LOC124421452 n=1 Tax=Lucilia cuprina TaxID=7375 RepID=UPI001F0707B7|nr:uncharacterized protein LOC124421452 [Lucilia cuprina]